MKTKVETRPALETCVKLIHTQSNKTVKVVRSGNDQEFKMNDFFEKNGIIHQASCVESP